MPAPFDTPYMQRALLEILLLSVPAGVLGAWIVLRRLAFFTHAVGSAAFPGLVVAGPWGLAPPLAAAGSALGLAGGVSALRRRAGTDVATGLLLTAALAVGVVLASDVYEAGAGVDRLLFGSLLGVTDGDLALAAAAAVGVPAADAAMRRRWLVTSFDPDARSGRAGDLLLLALIAGAAVVALDAVGALLVSALFVVPAATAALVARSVRQLQLMAVALAAAEGVLALVLARVADVGPGAALAVLGGAVLAVVASVRRRR